MTYHMNVLTAGRSATDSCFKNTNFDLTLTYIYMESRKMVLMNLFAGQQWRNRHREQTFGHKAGGMRERDK